MDRRDMLTLLGAGALGWSALAGREARAQHPHHHDKAHGDCLAACTKCAEVCNETFHYCFSHLKDGHKEHARAATLTIDCQDFCKLAAALLARESDMMEHACTACAEVCRACAAECKAHDDPQMRECAEACSACERTCRAMAVHMKDHQHHSE
jgi:hypothetical protein